MPPCVNIFMANSTMPAASTTGGLITVDGVDGVGKTTQIELIRKWFRQHRQAAELVLTREPGGTAMGEKLRSILLNGRSLNISNQAELLLMFAARQQHLDEVILPAIAAGKWVLSDRFTDATYAYQGAGRGISMQRIAVLEQWVQGDFQPALTLILDIDVVASIKRGQRRIDLEDDFEGQAIAFKQAVRNGYLQRAAEFPERIKLIDSAGTIIDLQHTIQQILAEFFAKADTKQAEK